ncbi:cytochrome c biogenesis protein [Seonamhaeicola aphaedonensis]|uniref:Cytochrome c-type biogenesis protein CcsB n=1 Tax=Seonamhaeicola aphaedonensis TaxID=1461338 RepID=A0A3D9HFG6_9FLAO|nr:cytochrome c biogenesis protein CcsA [Seonamhaeicola aphaedonensis]RED48220.1 cytochrome c-type biogenesis protein CcsB [Seonamhaeicola aphaedonensis]
MQKILANILFSTRLTGFLFLVFAAAMVTGTFLDAGQETSPTPYTRNLIYNAWWFEAIMGLFIINFCGNIVRYRLYKKEKWATLILHVAFIFIFIGAFITRYVSFEGMMSIPEGGTENVFLSQKTYVSAYVDGDFKIDGVQQRLPLEYEVDFSKRLNNHFKVNRDYNEQPFTIELEKFVVGAEETIVPDDQGEAYLKLVGTSGGGRHNHFLKVGQQASIHNVIFTLNNPAKGAVNILYQGDSLAIESPFEGDYMVMATQEKGTLVKDSLQALKLRSLYRIGAMQIVIPEPVIKGVFDIVQKEQVNKNDEDGIVLKVSTGGETKRVAVLGGQGMNRPHKKIQVGGLDFAFQYGAKVLELPFSIKLNDFQADKFPGSDINSAYSSEVTVLDEQEGSFDYKIYMNNILNHRGYRFFQSSFFPDETGTILSVNHDYWGTLFTYIGYFMLYFGLLAILFVKGTRFSYLRKQLNKVKEKKSKLITVVFLCLGLSGFSQQHAEHDGHNHEHTNAIIAKPTKSQIDSILAANITPKEHAEKFSHLVIQDLDGRMKPVSTYASEMLRKLSKHDTYEDFDAHQVFLSMQESPRLWYNVPVIYLAKKKADTIRHIIGTSVEEKYVTLADFFTDKGELKIQPYLEDAFNTTQPNGYQKEIQEAYKRVSLLYNAIEGMSLRLFPIPNDSNNTWMSSYDYRFQANKIKDSLYGNFIKNGFQAYLVTLNQAKQSGDYSEAEKLLEAFKKTQHKYGGDVMLSDDKVHTEVLYNKYDIFERLFSWYMYAGSLMFILLIVQIFRDKSKVLNNLISVFKWIIVGLFFLHLGGLILRWYVSGHAPWSNAYESMIYVAWSTMLFGLITGITKRSKGSNLTVASAAFVTSMLLMVAHFQWMDPAIGNLQPVLNSYWLMIHVAVIVASYGPFTLGMILGAVSLFLMALTTSKNRKKMNLNINELTIINEMALTVGLVMLTIGNFLGGMWANESWGRYWGWDPKETWALISIIIYAFVIHMRLIPGLRGRWLFNLSSVIAISFIIFTYFGVNFYLAGLHSYQSGQQLDSFKIIAIACCFVALLGFFSYRGYIKYYKK